MNGGRLQAPCFEWEMAKQASADFISASWDEFKTGVCPVPSRAVTIEVRDTPTQHGQGLLLQKGENFFLPLQFAPVHRLMNT